MPALGCDGDDVLARRCSGFGDAGAGFRLAEPSCGHFDDGLENQFEVGDWRRQFGDEVLCRADIEQPSAFVDQCWAALCQRVSEAAGGKAFRE